MGISMEVPPGTKIDLTYDPAIIRGTHQTDPNVNVPQQYLHIYAYIAIAVLTTAMK